jgi:hypothetical protein
MPYQAPDAQNATASAAACEAGWTCHAFEGYACRPPSTIYSASLYWAIMTLTSIGYGDIGATPFNAAEQNVCSLLMLLGAICWGYVLGTFCGVIASLAPSTADFRRTMDDLNSFLSANHISPDLSKRLREYFHRTKHLRDADKHQQLMVMMSPMLQSEIVLAVNKAWLSQVWYLARAEREFVVSLTISLSPMVLAPIELAPSGFLYILYRGVVLYNGRVLTRGQTWGEDIIVSCVAPHLCRAFNARAMNFAEVFIIDWPTLEVAASAFPTTDAHIRRCAKRLAMRRMFILAARIEVARQRALATGREPLEVSCDGSFNWKGDKRRQLSGGGGSSKSGTGKFMRGHTLTNMLRHAGDASQAEVSLQAQLLNLRRGSSSGRSGSLTDAINSSPKQASGWTERASGTGAPLAAPVGSSNPSSPRTSGCSACTADDSMVGRMKSIARQQEEHRAILQALARAMDNQASALSSLSSKVGQLLLHGTTPSNGVVIHNHPVGGSNPPVDGVVVAEPGLVANSTTPTTRRYEA